MNLLIRIPGHHNVLDSPSLQSVICCEFKKDFLDPATFLAIRNVLNCAVSKGGGCEERESHSIALSLWAPCQSEYLYRAIVI